MDLWTPWILGGDSRRSGLVFPVSPILNFLMRNFYNLVEALVVCPRERMPGTMHSVFRRRRSASTAQSSRANSSAPYCSWAAAGRRAQAGEASRVPTSKRFTRNQCAPNSGKTTISGRSPCQPVFYHTLEPLNCANAHAAAAARRHRVDDTCCLCDDSWRRCFLGRCRRRRGARELRPVSPLWKGTAGAASRGEREILVKAERASLFAAIRADLGHTSQIERLK